MRKMMVFLVYATCEMNVPFSRVRSLAQGDAALCRRVPGVQKAVRTVVSERRGAAPAIFQVS